MHAVKPWRSNDLSLFFFEVSLSLFFVVCVCMCMWARVKDGEIILLSLFYS